MLFLDTNALVWMFEGRPKLGKSARKTVEEALKEGQLALSAYVFWEIALLQLENRLPLSAPLYAWRKALVDFGVVELPVTGEIAIASWHLDGFHKDPADRIIVATALHYQAALMTADEKILRWKGGLKCLDARK